MIKRIGLLVSAMVFTILSGCGDGEAVDEHVEVSRPVPMIVVGTSDHASNLRFPGRVRAAQRADRCLNCGLSVRPGPICQRHRPRSRPIPEKSVMHDREFYDDEVVRCPWCGARAYFDDIDRPFDYCHHEEIHEPTPPREAPLSSPIRP